MQKIVSYAGTGVMLVAISVMVPNVERPDYLPLFLLQAAFVLVSAVVYGLSNLGMLLGKRFIQA